MAQAQMKYGCKHYDRKCELLTPCCGKFYCCRFCHNEKEEGDHASLDQITVTQIRCLVCTIIQDVCKTCKVCRTEFGTYFCRICRLYDDADKGQFHCDACGICRVGGKHNYFHCNVCGLCLHVTLKNSHACRENASKANCPLCLENIHLTREEIAVPKCGHLIHKKCIKDLEAAGVKNCTICMGKYD